MAHGLRLAFLFLLLVGSANAQERTGISTTGAIAASKLVAITNEGGLTLEATGKRTTYASAQLVSWGNFREPKRGPLIVLADGSWIVGEPTELSSESLGVDARLAGNFVLSRRVVRGVIFRVPGDAAERDKLIDRLTKRREPGDWLLLANGDELTGKATGQQTEKGATEEQLLFKVGAAKEPSQLAFSKLAALAFDSVLVDEVKPRGAHTLVGLRDGSYLAVEKVANHAGRVDLMLVCGALVQVDLEALGTDIVAWQPQQSGVVYLSDLKESGYKHIPFLSEAWPFYADRNCHGGRLRVADALYPKGLGMRSTARLSYDLDREYKSLAAEIALDRSAGERGSVIFRVFTAGADGTFKAAYESPIVRGGAAPLPISVDLKGIKRIALIVDFAERGDECDDADWLNARLVP